MDLILLKMPFFFFLFCILFYIILFFHMGVTKIAWIWVTILPSTLSLISAFVSSFSVFRMTVNCSWSCESEVAQSCPTLCDPVDCSPPGSSVHGILRPRILEWVAISFSRGSSRPRGRTQLSCMAGRRFNLWATREDERKNKWDEKCQGVAQNMTHDKCSINMSRYHHHAHPWQLVKDSHSFPTMSLRILTCRTQGIGKWHFKKHS